MRYSFILFVENKPGVLYRVTDLFLRRKINIESLTVAQVDPRGISRMTVVAQIDEKTAEKLSKQLYRIVEVLKVIEAKDEELIAKEIALFKVSTRTPNRRMEVENLAGLFGAKAVFVGEDFLVIEAVGREEEIDSLALALKPFGIKEMVRSGRVAIKKEEEKRLGKFDQKLPSCSFGALSIEVSAIKKLQLYAQKTASKKEVISLAQGIPDFPTPSLIKEAAKEAIDKGLTDKYTAGYGIDQLRLAIVEKLKRDNQIIAQPDQVIVTHGAIEALMATFLALFNPGDEVIVITPDYASHITQLNLTNHGGRPLFFPLKEEDSWQVDFEQLEALVTQKTKGILLCNPSNPTGKVYTKEELKKIAFLSRKHNLFIITDETYEYLTFDNRPHISIGSFPEVANRTISIFSLSKSYSMTGWRIGYLVADKEIANQIFKVHDALITCPTAVSQYAALAAFKLGKKGTEKFRKEYEKRRDLLVKILNQRKDLVSLITPQGAYYAFVKINFPIDDYQLAYQLVDEAGVATVPGSAFGPGGENHLRISFGVSEKQLIQGLKRLLNYLDQLSVKI